MILDIIISSDISEFPIVINTHFLQKMLKMSIVQLFSPLLGARLQFTIWSVFFRCKPVVEELNSTCIGISDEEEATGEGLEDRKILPVRFVLF